MAAKPSNVNVSINGMPPNVSYNPDPVKVRKSKHEDGVKWTITNKDFIFTGVRIAGTDYTPGSSGSGDFSGLTIDNTVANNHQSVMVVDDSLAEIQKPTDQDDYSYKIYYKARPPGSEQHSFDPTIRNEN